jgi:hypothetical protein
MIRVIFQEFSGNLQTMDSTPVKSLIMGHFSRSDGWRLNTMYHSAVLNLCSGAMLIKKTVMGC